MENALVNVNGKILSGSQAQVPLFDRGFLYGDSLYEVIRSYHGRLFELDAHLERLWNSAGLARIQIGQSREHFKTEIQKTLAAFHALPGRSRSEVYCRIFVSRGVNRVMNFSERLTHRSPSTNNRWLAPLGRGILRV
jgi:branched-chain amino acid aminotransferase